MSSLVTLTTMPSGAPKWNGPFQCWRTSATVSALMYGSKGMCVVMNNRGFARLATYPAA
jgi:hypothetical protein